MKRGAYLREYKALLSYLDRQKQMESKILWKYNSAEIRMWMNG